MALKGSEKFVAECLKRHHSSKFSSVAYREGEDPPDIYLSLDGNEISIEISDINYNSLKNNTGTVRGYLSFINTLDNELGMMVGNDIKIIINVYHFDVKVNKLKKEIRRYLEGLIKTIGVNKTHEKCFGKACLKVTAIKSTGGKKINGFVSNYGMLRKKSRDINTVADFLGEFDIAGNNYALLEDRVKTKNSKCRSLSMPIWLALKDEYYKIYTDFQKNRELFEHYRRLLDDISDFGVFEKIFIIFENEDVHEYQVKLKLRHDT